LGHRRRRENGVPSKELLENRMWHFRLKG
jgi:hypothetical protein